MDIKKNIHRILIEESNAILSIPITNDYQTIIEAIIANVHIKNGKIITCGMGKAGHVAKHIASKFCSTGSPAVFLHPSEAQHGDLGIVQPNDVVILISNSGMTSEIIDTIGFIRSLYSDIPIIAITGNPESKLAKLADYVLQTGRSPEIDPYGFVPTTSTTLMGVIGDILVVSIMESIGFTKQDYSRCHPGGTLGIMSRGRVVKP